MKLRTDALDDIANFSVVTDALEQLSGAASGGISTYRIRSKHSRDLLYLLVAYGLVFAAVSVLIIWIDRFAVSGPAPASGAAKLSGAPHPINPLTISIIFGTAVFGGYVTLVAKTVDNAQKRLATVDLFTSEILSIGRVFTSCNIVGDFTRLYAVVNRQGDTKKFGPAGFADAARSENYFATFDKNIPDLGPLSSVIINDIAAFYTFLKASRDTTGAISRWDAEYYSAEQKKRDIINIVYNCHLMAIHGRRALEGLIENPVLYNYSRSVFYSIETQCFLFLWATLKESDPRHAPVSKRAADYATRIDSCGDACAATIRKLVADVPRGARPDPLPPFWLRERPK